jgi:hypothetical protein
MSSAVENLLMKRKLSSNDDVNNRSHRTIPSTAMHIAAYKWVAEATLPDCRNEDALRKVVRFRASRLAEPILWMQRSTPGQNSRYNRLNSTGHSQRPEMIRELALAEQRWNRS